MRAFCHPTWKGNVRFWRASCMPTWRVKNQNRVLKRNVSRYSPCLGDQMTQRTSMSPWEQLNQLLPHLSTRVFIEPELYGHHLRCKQPYLKSKRKMPKSSDTLDKPSLADYDCSEPSPQAIPGLSPLSPNMAEDVVNVHATYGALLLGGLVASMYDWFILPI